MAVSDEYRQFIVGKLEPMALIRTKKMFGGVGLYCEEVFFALIANDTLYFKVDDSNRGDFESAGMGPFKPFEEKAYTMGYYEVPIDVLEDPELLNLWVTKSLKVARKKQKKRAKKKPTKKK